MANPTVNSGITQAASLRAAMWISPDVDQSGTPTKGAWDAQNTAFWAVAGTSGDLTSTAFGTSGVNGLTVANAVDSGIYYESAANQTGNLWETYGGGPLTIVALVKQSATGCIVLQNRDGWSPNKGYQFGVNADGSITFYASLGTGLIEATTSASQISNGEIAIIAATFDGVSGDSTGKIYKNGTLLLTSTGGSTTAPTWSGHTERRAGSFDLSNRTGGGYQAVGGSIGGVLFYSVVLSGAEVQTFGTASDLSTNFYSAAFTGLVSASGGGPLTGGLTRSILTKGRLVA